MAQYTEDKRLEIPDPTPVEMPLGYERPESLQSMIARMVRTFSDQAQKEGAESFEEADDFDIDDDSEIVSPYQMNDMQEERPYESFRTDNKIKRADKAPESAQEEPSNGSPGVAEKTAPKPLQQAINEPQKTVAQ